MNPMTDIVAEIATGSAHAAAPICVDPQTVAVRLEAAFERVRRERMCDVPILNPALAVKAVGTRDVEAGWLTALVTPWFINLMLLPRTPAQAQEFQDLRLGSNVVHRFPSGCFEFIVGEEGDLGRYQMCSLFSPVLEFESHGAALITAEAAITVLFDPKLAPDAPQEAGEAPSAGADLTPSRGPAEAGKLSRRGLFFGRNVETEAVES
jgi:[NiFe] hydrogenase assembly HybE family chaperone